MDSIRHGHGEALSRMVVLKSSSPISIVVPIAIAVAVIAGYVLYPLLAMARESLIVNGILSLQRYLELLSWHNAGFWEAVRNSIAVSIVTVILSGVVGTLFAVTLTQCDFVGKKIISALAVLPIGLPPLVGVISFLFVFGESGIIPRLLQQMFMSEESIFGVDGFAAILMVHVYSFYVYTYLFLLPPLRNIDGSLIEAAASVGAGAWTTFLRVILPEIRSALTGAALLTFMASMASFTAPFLFGGDKRFLTTLIYSTKLNGDIELAAAQSVLLGIASVMFFFFFRRTASTSTRAAKGSSRMGKIAIRSLSRRIIIVGTVALFVFELLPILTILLIAFAKEGSWTWQIFPTAYTLENFQKLLSDAHVFEPILNSIMMSLLTLAFCLLVGVTVSYVIVRGSLGRWRTPFELLVNIPFALPGTIIAIGLLIVFNSSHVLGGFAVLVGSFWILPIAYFARSYPLVVRSTSAALETLDGSLVEAGAALGASFWLRLRKVVLPLIGPGIISGALLVLIASLGEFVSSILLYSFNNRPIAVEILSQMRMYNFGGAAAYCVFLLLLILACVGGASFATSRLEQKLGAK